MAKNTELYWVWIIALQARLEESHFIYKNTENQTVEGEEARWRTAFSSFFFLKIPIEQQLKAPGCTHQDAVWWPQSKPQRYWLLLSYDLRHSVRCFIRRVSETIAVWFLSSGGARPSTFCGEWRRPSCCCNTKHTQKKKYGNTSELFVQMQMMKVSS